MTGHPRKVRRAGQRGRPEGQARGAGRPEGLAAGPEGAFWPCGAALRGAAPRGLHWCGRGVRLGGRGMKMARGGAWRGAQSGPRARSGSSPCARRAELAVRGKTVVSDWSVEACLGGIPQAAPYAILSYQEGVRILPRELAAHIWCPQQRWLEQQSSGAGPAICLALHIFACHG